MKNWQNWLISIMGTVIALGIAAWLTLARTAVTRAEMNEAIIPQAKQVELIAVDIKAISADMAAMKTRQAVMEQKIDTLTEQIRESRKP